MGTSQGRPAEQRRARPPVSQVVAPAHPGPESQKSREPDGPISQGVPGTPLGDGAVSSSQPRVQGLRGGGHSSQLCSADSAGALHLFLGCRASRGSGGRNVLLATLPTHCGSPHPQHTHAYAPFPCFMKCDSCTPRSLVPLGCWWGQPCASGDQLILGCQNFPGFSAGSPIP